MKKSHNLVFYQHVWLTTNTLIRWTWPSFLTNKGPNIVNMRVVEMVIMVLDLLFKSRSPSITTKKVKLFAEL